MLLRGEMQNVEGIGQPNDNSGATKTSRQADRRDTRPGERRHAISDRHTPGHAVHAAIAKAYGEESGRSNFGAWSQPEWQALTLEVRHPFHPLQILLRRFNSVVKWNPPARQKPLQA